MWYKDEIGSGWELADKLWSGAKTNFDDWIERGADPDDILNAVEMLFEGDEEPPTLTAINDVLWFEPETIEEFLGLSSEEEIESACHGKSKKDEKKKPVKSGRVTKDMWDEHLTELAIPKKDKIKYGLEEDDFFDEYSSSPETPPFELQEELEEGDDTVPFFNDVDERDDYYYSHVKSSRRPVKSAMPGKEKGIQAIMDEYGCTREEAEEIMNEQIDSGRKPVKSAWYDDDEPFNPADVDTITAEDIREAREAIETTPESTWHKVLYRFNDGDELCLTAGMGEGFDEDTVCAKLAVLPSNSGMSDYSWDFIMPYDKDTGDVWDTEVSNFDESDLDWFNKEAVNMAQEVSEGKWSKE